MLGIFGFISATVIFLLYSLSFNKIHLKKSKVLLDFYQFSYVMLGLACFFWALGIFIDNDTALVRSIILGNISILIGTISIAYSVLGKKYKNPVAIGLILLSLIFVIARVFFQVPEPFVDDGILVFNSSTAVGIVFGFVFLAIWLPASLVVIRALTEKTYFRPLRNIGEFSVILASMGVLTFLAADTNRMIVLSFGVICCSYGPLIGINYLIKRGVKK